VGLVQQLNNVRGTCAPKEEMQRHSAHERAEETKAVCRRSQFRMDGQQPDGAVGGDTQSAHNSNHSTCRRGGNLRQRRQQLADPFAKRSPKRGLLLQVAEIRVHERPRLIQNEPVAPADQAKKPYQFLRG
jgi:hypothetical protein